MVRVKLSFRTEIEFLAKNWESVHHDLEIEPMPSAPRIGDYMRLENILPRHPEEMFINDWKVIRLLWDRDEQGYYLAVTIQGSTLEEQNAA